jgi:DNA-binding XRE family transcriptional regulator
LKTTANFDICGLPRVIVLNGDFCPGISGSKPISAESDVMNVPSFVYHDATAATHYRLRAMKKLTPEQLMALRSVPLGAMPNKLAVARAMVEADQTDLAEASGLSQPTVSDAEAGRVIKLPTAQRIAVALGAQVDDLFPSREAVA